MHLPSPIHFSIFRCMEGLPSIPRLRQNGCLKMSFTNAGTNLVRLFLGWNSKCYDFFVYSFSYTQFCRYHIFMGFTLCGRFVISYTEKVCEPDQVTIFAPVDYELYIWRFIPGQQLQYVSKHRIFKLYKSLDILDEIMFMQFPVDPYKLICYGTA